MSRRLELAAACLVNDEPDYRPPDDSTETCFFWDGTRCRFEQLVIGVGGPCADCPEEDAAVASLTEDGAR